LFADIDDVDSGEINGDLCIIGGGAAGISLAKQFEGSAYSVILLEAGGFEFEESTQALYRGENAGLMYFPLAAARLRYFGGSTGHWGGACVPLSAIDLEKKDWLPGSGWPFPVTELNRYYPAAQELCGVGPFDYSMRTWSDPDTSPPLPLDVSRVESRLYQNSKPLRFGTYYRDELRDADNIRVILHANVLEIVANTGNETITHVIASSLGGRKLTVKARIFVICAGGIESPRLLLLSNNQYSNGIGNQHDLVGRYFMDHIHIMDAGELLLPEKHNLELYKRHEVNGIDVRTGLGLSRESLRENRLLNTWIGFKLRGAPVAQERNSSYNYLKRSFEKGQIPEDMWRHIAAVMDDLGDRIVHKLQKLAGNDTDSDKVWRKIGFSTHSEQAPNPDSRVYLGDETDELGQRRLVMDWRLTEADHHCIRETLVLVAREIGASGLGRMQIAVGENDDAWTTPDALQGNVTPTGSFHHMGTTRMHNSPREGVVDPDLKIHGLKNIYVLGSSVFPTCGWANPTLTIVALSVRLADHLKTRMA